MGESSRSIQKHVHNNPEAEWLKYGPLTQLILFKKNKNESDSITIVNPRSAESKTEFV